MNPAIIWMIISAIILVVVGIICIIVVRKKGKQQPDYYIFFILGVIWFPMGVIFDNIVFMILGFIFFAVGLVNKERWERPDYLIKGRFWRWIIIALALLVLLGVIISYLVIRKGL